MPDPVRFGDRYLRGLDKITIMKVDDATIVYAITAEGSGATWVTSTTLPLPDTWTKVGSGPVVKEMCLNCETYEVEPAQYFCVDCMTVLAKHLADFPADAIALQVETMRLRRKQREKESNG